MTTITLKSEAQLSQEGVKRLVDAISSSLSIPKGDIVVEDVFEEKNKAVLNIFDKWMDQAEKSSIRLKDNQDVDNLIDKVYE